MPHIVTILRLSLPLLLIGAAFAPLQTRLEALFAAQAPGTRFGMVVTDESGREIVAIAPDSRFIPASNTKIVTTAALFETVGGLDAPDKTGGAAVRLEPAGKGAFDVVLEGHGDARLSSAADCVTDCLATLADAVAARTKRVRLVVGDDSAYPDERWSQGMSWNNLQASAGTAVSALTLDDNELALTITPTRPGAPPTIDMPPYLEIEDRALTIPGNASAIVVSRAPDSRIVRATGTIGAHAKPERMRISVDDPPRYAAWRLADLLRARGVDVSGMPEVRHRPLAPSDDPAIRAGAPAPRPPAQPVLAHLVPPPLADDVMLTNHVSQNLHAELFLRRVAQAAGSGSVADGLAVERAMLARAGLQRRDFDFSDGCGMSSYDRITPRAIVTLLRWIATRPWGPAWQRTLPVAAESGTLARRFRGTMLAGRLAAKTGSLNAASALAGSMIAASGKTLVFALYANDMPSDVSALPAMDAALETVAAEN